MTRSQGDAKGRFRAWMVAIAFVVVALLVVGWVVATKFQSPEQREANAEPPAQTPVVVTVQVGDLVDQTTVLGELSGDSNNTVDLISPTGRAVVTKAPLETGAVVNSGQIGLWVNDRPVFMLSGEFPMYRELAEGDQGDDVAQFQAALNQAGYSLSQDGDFGPGTAAAVRDLYKRAGVSVPTRSVVVKATTATKVEGAQSGASVADKTVEIVRVPLEEFVFAPTLPAVLAGAPKVGSLLSSETAVLVFEDARQVLRASISSGMAMGLTPGLTATATVGEQTVDVRMISIQAATVSKSAQAPANETSDLTTLLFEPIQGDYPAEWTGVKDALITINLSDPLTGVLLVPQRAIALDAAGASKVLVLDKARNEFTEEIVTELGCVSGTCAVKESGKMVQGVVVRVDGQGTTQ